MKNKVILIAILLLAFFLRAVDINDNPPSMYGDELTLAYDAYSLLKTGHDQTGKFLPITFTMSEGRSPAYVYISLPIVAVFGPSAFAVRLLSVLSGVGIVFLMYLLTLGWLGRNRALLVAAFTAVLPWDITLSRGGFETHFALFLGLLGIFALVKAKAHPRWLIISAVSFGLTIHAYHSYKITLPLFLLLLAWFVNFWKDIFIKKFRVYLIISGLIFISLVVLWLSQLTQGSDVRFSTTNVFGQQNLREKLIQNINSERSSSNLPLPLAAASHNIYLSYALMVGENYLQNFMPNFLFIHGDLNPRHNPALMGGFYLAQAILIIIGLVSIFQNRLRLFIFLIGWILLAPLPTALVSEPHALRSAFMIPPLLIFAGEGGIILWDKAKKDFLSKIVLTIVLISLVIQMVFMIERIYFLSPNLFGHFWSYSAKQASQLAVENKSKFDYIILSGHIDNIEYAYPTYERIDPQLIINQNKERAVLQGSQFKKIENIYIGASDKENLVKFIQSLPGSVMYIGDRTENGVLGENYVFDKNRMPSLIIYTK